MIKPIVFEPVAENVGFRVGVDFVTAFLLQKI